MPRINHAALRGFHDILSWTLHFPPSTGPLRRLAHVLDANPELDGKRRPGTIAGMLASASSPGASWPLLSWLLGDSGDVPAGAAVAGVVDAMERQRREYLAVAGGAFCSDAPGVGAAAAGGAHANASGTSTWHTALEGEEEVERATTTAWGTKETGADAAATLAATDSSSSEAEAALITDVRFSSPGTNVRMLEAAVRIRMDRAAVWRLMTDYDGLKDFIPKMTKSHRLPTEDGRIRIYQEGLQQVLGLAVRAGVVLEMEELMLTSDNDMEGSGQVEVGGGEEEEEEKERWQIRFRLVDSPVLSEYWGRWELTEQEEEEDKGENSGGEEEKEEVKTEKEGPGQQQQQQQQQQQHDRRRRRRCRWTLAHYRVTFRPRGPLPAAWFLARLEADVRASLLAIKQAAEALPPPDPPAAALLAADEADATAAAAAAAVTVSPSKGSSSAAPVAPSTPTTSSSSSSSWGSLAQLPLSPVEASDDDGGQGEAVEAGPRRRAKARGGRLSSSLSVLRSLLQRRQEGV